jgi:hypothetical protein
MSQTGPPVDPSQEPATDGPSTRAERPPEAGPSAHARRPQAERPAHAERPAQAGSAAKGEMMGKEARVALILAGSAFFIAALLDWVVQELQ